MADFKNLATSCHGYICKERKRIYSEPEVDIRQNMSPFSSKSIGGMSPVQPMTDAHDYTTRPHL